MGAVDVKYDKFRDMTFVNAGPLPLEDTSYRFLVLTGVYTGQHRDPQVLSIVSFAVGSARSDPSLSTSDELDLLLDGKTALQFSDASHTSASWMSATIPPGQFPRIARAKTIELQVAGSQYSLSPAEMETLHLFARRVNP